MRIQISLGPLILLDLSLLVPTNPSPNVIVINNTNDEEEDDDKDIFGGGGKR